MPTVQSVRVLATDSIGRRRKITEAEQEQLAGAGRSGMLASMTKAP